MKRRYSTLLTAVRTTVTNSHYIAHLSALERGPIVLYARVSSRTQKGNLGGQLSNLESEVQQLGFEPIASFAEVVSIRSRESTIPIQLERAILTAQSAHCPVVAESLNRFIRSLGGKDAPLSVFEMEFRWRRCFSQMRPKRKSRVTKRDVGKRAKEIAVGGHVKGWGGQSEGGNLCCLGRWGFMKAARAIDRLE
jgi:hypothetical protein